MEMVLPFTVAQVKACGVALLGAQPFQKKPGREIPPTSSIARADAANQKQH